METSNHTLDAKIEALLFYKGEPISISSMAKSLKVTKEEIETSLNILKEKLQNRGIVLITNNEEVMVGTHPDFSSFFEELRKEELTKELSRASLETLSIVLYKQKVSRADIDYIRGVNSSFILRNLQIRGLVDKKTDEKDSRISIYIPSVELLSYLGVSNINELPDFENVSKTLQDKIEKSLHEDHTE